LTPEDRVVFSGGLASITMRNSGRWTERKALMKPVVQ
jgi:hypothetical protein